MLNLKNEENGVEGDLGLEFYDLDGSDDPVRKVKTTSTTPRSAILKYIFNGCTKVMELLNYIVNFFSQEVHTLSSCEAKLRLRHRQLNL